MLLKEKSIYYHDHKNSIQHYEIVAKTLAKLEQLKTQYIKGIISEDDYLIARRQLLLEFD